MIASDLELWSFWDFGYSNGNNPVDDWHRALSEHAQQLFNALLKDIRKIEDPRNWTGSRGFLKGKYKQERIWELGFQTDKRQYRVLGVFGEKKKHAILLAGCHHKGRVYTPPNALDVACARSKLLSRRETILYERKIEDDI